MGTIPFCHHMGSHQPVAGLAVALLLFFWSLVRNSLCVWPAEWRGTSRVKHRLRGIQMLREGCPVAAVPPLQPPIALGHVEDVWLPVLWPDSISNVLVVLAVLLPT